MEYAWSREGIPDSSQEHAGRWPALPTPGLAFAFDATRIPSVSAASPAARLPAMSVEVVKKLRHFLRQFDCRNRHLDRTMSEPVLPRPITILTNADRGFVAVGCNPMKSSENAGSENLNLARLPIPPR